MNVMCIIVWYTAPPQTRRSNDQGRTASVISQCFGTNYHKRFYDPIVVRLERSCDGGCVYLYRLFDCNRRLSGPRSPRHVTEGLVWLPHPHRGAGRYCHNRPCL